MSAIDIKRQELMGDVARTLIGALNAELSAQYPEPGATHFHLDPREVAPGSARTLPNRRLHEHSTYGEHGASTGASVCLSKEL
jgi:hypothetical protein